LLAAPFKDQPRSLAASSSPRDALHEFALIDLGKSRHLARPAGGVGSRVRVEWWKHHRSRIGRRFCAIMMWVRPADSDGKGQNA
jgi:hypothetical protein